MSRISVSVFRKTGRKGFHFIWKDPITGKRRIKASGATKKREAERAALLFEEELNRHAFPNSITWDEFIALYERHSLKHLADATAYSANSAFNWFTRSTGVQRIEQVPELIGKYRLALMESELSPASQIGYLKHFRSACNWATENGYLAEKVKIKMPPSPEMEMKGRPLTRAEYQAMLLTATDRPQGGSYVHLMTGLWLSGLRRGEAMKLSWGRDAPFAVDMTGEYPRLRIRNRAQKSKRAQLAPITPDFSKFLLSQKDRSGFVFHPLGEEGQRVSLGSPAEAQNVSG